jgi:HK97 family phage major capsid protein
MTVNELKARLREINTQAKDIEDAAELDKLTAEADEINAKITEAANRAHLEALAKANPEDKVANGVEAVDDSATKRGKALLAGAKISRKFNVKNAVSTANIPLTQHTATDVNIGFNEISSVIDGVRLVPLIGGESYKRGFVKGYGIGGYTAENADYNSAEPTFGYAEMTKTKVTAYAEEPEEIAKLAPSAYDSIIGQSTEVAIRKYLAKQILVGDGASGHLTGIFYLPASASDDIIDRTTDISISAIDATTLDKIVYSFGGDEDVEAPSVLILNKADLKAFATLRNEDGKKTYNVVYNGNYGTIDGIPYIINSVCPAVSNTATAADTYCMAYGSLSNYELAVFSDMDVQRSTEYKFKQGQIAHRADIFVGGNVAAYNGFLRIKKN